MTHNDGSKFDSAPFSFIFLEHKRKQKVLFLLTEMEERMETTYDSRQRRRRTIQPMTIACHSKEIRPIRPCGHQPSVDCGTFWCESFSTF
jgi:hypothetical protein